MKKILLNLLILLLLLNSCEKSGNHKHSTKNIDINYIQAFCDIDFPNVLDDYVLHYPDLKILYDSTNYNFVWFDGDSLSEKAQMAIRQMQRASTKGLNESFYHLSQLQKLIDLYNNSSNYLKKITKTGIDIQLSDSYIQYCYHLFHGWSKNQIKKPNTEILHAILNENLECIHQIIEPKNTHYKNYVKYWEAFVEKFSHLPESDIPFLQDDSVNCYKKTSQRLQLLNILNNKDSSNMGAIRNAMLKFQYQFGLESSGKPDSLSVIQLNRGFNYYHEQAMLTIEKMKLLNLDSLPSFILINIPTFTLFWIEQNELVSTHRVVTGTIKNQTPELSSSITKFTLFPDWNLPYSIATKETLPNIKRNVKYLEKNKYIITNSNRKIVDPNTVNWSKLNRSNFPYRIVQTPGEHNALGLIKYFFNNSHDVYLHDTPQKRFFQRNIRSFSHGCMRLEKPFEFLKTILEYQEGMLHYSEDLLKEKNLANAQKKFEKIRLGEENIALMDTVNDHLKRRQQSDFRLKKSIPLRVTYFCSFYDFEGTILFYPDIYNRDEALTKELREMRNQHN